LCLRDVSRPARSYYSRGVGIPNAEYSATAYLSDERDRIASPGCFVKIYRRGQVDADMNLARTGWERVQMQAEQDRRNRVNSLRSLETTVVTV